MARTDEKRPSRPQTAIAIAAVLLAVVAVFLLLWRGPWVLDRLQLGHLGKDDGPRATVVAGFRTALAALVVGTVGVGGLYFTAKTLQHTRDKDRKQEELTREGQVTDRYIKAVGLLATSDEKAITARMAGVYALQRIMRDSEKDHDTIVQLLAAFIRQSSPMPPPEPVGTTTTAARRMVPDDVQAALTVLAHRPEREEQFRIDLSNADLSGAELATARLEGATFVGSRLDRASLTGARLRKANLWKASLEGAVADGADLSNTSLEEANLTTADLTGADLRESTLRSAILHFAHLTRAKLDGADLMEAQLMAADGTAIAITDGPQQLLKARRVTRATLLNPGLAADPELARHIEACDHEYLGG
ncbi:pentapeptide repeat-containing protein [Streptomyces tateyamensis]|uniref:pentapeptide repeat-containing protein n=1 Tax=Streptomyces tateyamensis TaxID=565073 RepID=UPI0015E8AA24|nr:pentapeptide repeat-containing protein [Streptomyces tateyamensis]